jgi:hypothetical protein
MKRATAKPPLRVLALVAIVGLVVVSCGDDNAAVPTIPADPVSATTCDELADAVVATNQELIDEVADMSVEDFTAAGGPLAYEGWVTKAQLGASRMSELGCGPVLEGMLAERAGRLHASGPAGESLIADFIGNLP